MLEQGCQTLQTLGQEAETLSQQADTLASGTEAWGDNAKSLKDGLISLKDSLISLKNEFASSSSETPVAADHVADVGSRMTEKVSELSAAAESLWYGLARYKKSGATGSSEPHVASFQASCLSLKVGLDKWAEDLASNAEKAQVSASGTVIEKQMRIIKDRFGKQGYHMVDIVEHKDLTPLGDQPERLKVYEGLVVKGAIVEDIQPPFTCHNGFEE
jgi:hypothetical protein